jgi:hypothetical protein
VILIVYQRVMGEIGERLRQSLEKQGLEKRSKGKRGGCAHGSLTISMASVHSQIPEPLAALRPELLEAINV